MFLSPPELAKRYHVPEATVYQWRYKGYGPRAIKIGRHLRYDVAECERWERELAARAS